MGKRSNFTRRPQDAYDTPPEAVAPLIHHLPPAATFWEPCAGKLDLAFALEAQGMDCLWASDVNPRCEQMQRHDAFAVSKSVLDSWAVSIEYIVTNPPWTREILHPMIEHFASMRPTWLLFDADWMHTKQAEPYLKLCRKIVSVGRVKWIPDSKYTGKDNCAWYLFDANSIGDIRFFGRAGNE